MTAASAVPPMLRGRRATWIEIDLDALATNLRALQSACGGRPLWAVVKADAYGHGAAACGPVLETAGAAGLVVALPEEAEVLRHAGVRLPILLSGPLPAGDLATVRRLGLAPALSRVEDLLALEAAQPAGGPPLDYHLELDTGLTRMGVDADGLDVFLEAAGRCRRLVLRSILSHLAPVTDAGGPEARAQMQMFQQLAARVRTVMGRDLPCQLAASPALCSLPEATFDAVRPGLLLYGVTPVASLEPPAPLRPVLSLHTTVILVRQVDAGTPVGYDGAYRTSRPCHIAVLAAGYADGLRRDAAGRAEALVAGSRFPYVGAVNMDLAQVEAAPASRLEPGMVATLVGRQGDDAVTIEELAQRTQRTPYEWLTGLGARIPRLLRRDGVLSGLYEPQRGVVTWLPDESAAVH